MDKHLIYSGFKRCELLNSKSYDGISFIPFQKKLDTSSLKPILGATNCEYQIRMVAGDGIVQVNKETPLRYEIKSIAMAVFRCVPEEEAEFDEGQYLKL